MLRIGNRLPLRGLADQDFVVVAESNDGGVVRSPSAFSMTLTLSPSMTATQELVVPRSMPMILPMMLFLRIEFSSLDAPALPIQLG